MRDYEAHAVRWVKCEIKSRFETKHTRWHWTKNGQQTLCGRYILVGGEGKAFLPETDDFKEIVDCKICVKKI